MNRGVNNFFGFYFWNNPLKD